MFWLNETVDGKITNRKSLERVAKQTGKDPETLFKLPEVEPEITYILKWYFEIKGGTPMTYQEIEAWQRLKAIAITPSEVETLMLIDCDYYKTKSNGNQ